LERILELIKANVATKKEDLIRQLDSKLMGWSNYFRHVVAKKTLSYVDNQVFSGTDLVDQLKGFLTLMAPYSDRCIQDGRSNTSTSAPMPRSSVSV